jgi:hypothetical protein
MIDTTAWTDDLKKASPTHKKMTPKNNYKKWRRRRTSIPLLDFFAGMHNKRKRSRPRKCVMTDQTSRKRRKTNNKEIYSIPASDTRSLFKKKTSCIFSSIQRIPAHKEGRKLHVGTLVGRLFFFYD